MNEEEATEKATEVGEFVISRLDVAAGDTVIVRAPAGWDAEDVGRFYLSLNQWSEHEGVDVHWLVLPPGSDIGVMHNLTDEEIAKAGAGGWPHEG